MKAQITSAWSHKELREVLENYFKCDNAKPLIICSKPFSGRTSAVEDVAKTLGITLKDIFNKHLYFDPFGKEKGMDVLIDEAIKGTFGSDRKYKILEMDPNWMSAMPDDTNPFNPKAIDLGTGLINCYESENYHIVFFRPTVKDWIEWAEKETEIFPEVIDFAREYPAYYAITYDIYLRLYRQLSVFSPGDELTDLMMLGYTGFMYKMTKPICETFVEHLLGTRFKEILLPE